MKHLLILVVFAWSGLLLKAQDCLDVLQSDLYNNPKNLINGTKWFPEKKYSGSPLLEVNYWPKAEIVFNGKRYQNIQMNYDILKDELIVFIPEKGNEKYVVLNKEKLTEFSYLDTISKRKHFYYREEFSKWKGTSLFEKVQFKKYQLFVKPMKEFKATSSEINVGKLSEFYYYYIDLGGGLVRFSSKRQFINLLPDHRTEMKKYIRKENLLINVRHPEDIVTAITYLEGLTN